MEMVQRQPLLSSSTRPFCILPSFLRPLSLRRPSLPKPLSPPLCLTCTTLPSLSSSNTHRRRLLPHPLPALTDDEVAVGSETMLDESDFIEVGYISNVHGLHGELRVKPATDFPELRFSTPGTRFLSTQVSGKKIIREVELIEGRGHSGQKGWIVSFDGIDTVDEARQYVGSTLLVKENDRPTLEDGEHYVPDLIGMKVILKDTSEQVGIVVNVFKSGPSDLLQVKLWPSEINEVTPSGHLVWVPFVEAIVPDVDMSKREMHITPPKGLLKLNIRRDSRTKKERRQLQWKERKKLQQQLTAAKRKLAELGQQHILKGFSFGDKAQKTLLANQIVGIDFKLLQEAIKCLYAPSSRFDLTGFISTNLPELSRNTMRVSKESLVPNEIKKTSNINHERGVDLISKGKVAMIFLVGENRNQESSTDPDAHDLFDIEALLDDIKMSKVDEYCMLLPLIFVIPSHKIQAYEKLFSDHEFFGFDAGKVWLLEEEQLPMFNSGLTAERTHKMLLGSPWEILQFPVGSGRIFRLLSSHNIIDEFNKMGIEYVEICSLHKRSYIGNPTFFGLVDTCKADLGVKILDQEENHEEFDIIFTTRILNKMASQMDGLHFYPVPTTTSHVECVDNQWTDVKPSSPNSYMFHCSIYSSFNVCSPDKICLIQIAD